MNRVSAQPQRGPLRCLTYSPPGPSHLQQMERTSISSPSSDQAGPVKSSPRRSSRTSATPSSTRSARSSVSSRASVSSQKRHDSGTSFLSGITLGMEQATSVLGTKAMVWPARALDSVVRSFRHIPDGDGNFVRAHVTISAEWWSIDKIVDIPLALFDYDRNDKILIQCIRSRRFEDCRISKLVFSKYGNISAWLYQRPVLTADGGDTWKTFAEIKVVGCRENKLTPQPKGFCGQLACNLKLQDGRSPRGVCLWVPSSILRVDRDSSRELRKLENESYDREYGSESSEEEEEGKQTETKPPFEPRQHLIKWIKESRLFVTELEVNKLGRVQSGWLFLQEQKRR